MKSLYDDLPRCEALDGSSLSIVPSYIEAGRLCEALSVTLTDGERTALYVPYARVERLLALLSDIRTAQAITSPLLARIDHEVSGWSGE